MFKTQATLRSDPRASCAIIAKSVLVELRAQHQDSPARVFARTLLRLLDSYRFGLVREEHSRGVLQFTPLATVVDLAERQDDNVRSAIERAHRAVFPDQSVQEVVASLSYAVKHYFGLPGAEREGVNEVLPVEKLVQFLTQLEDQL